MALLAQPTEEPPHADQAAVHRGDGLAQVAAKVVLEVGQIAGGDAADGEWLPVGSAEPASELPQVVGDGPAAVVGQVVVVQILGGEGCLLPPDRDARERLSREFRHPSGHESDIN